MTSHDLAKILLLMPDGIVIGRQVGQGSHEGQDEELQNVEQGKEDESGEIHLIF